jgi:hypothetical protein
MAEPESLERTLALARSGLAPSVAEKQRLRTVLALGATASPAPMSPAAEQDPAREKEAAQPPPGRAGPAGSPGVTGWPAIRASGKAGVLSGLLLVGAGFAGGYWLAQRESRPAPTDVTVTARAATPSMTRATPTTSEAAVNEARSPSIAPSAELSQPDTAAQSELGPAREGLTLPTQSRRTLSIGS